MSVVRPQFVNDEIYHIMMRGVEQRRIFQDASDLYRGIFSLYEFNDDKPVLMRDRRKLRRQQKQASQSGRGQPSATLALSFGPVATTARELFVKILAFCLMPNHIHLLLQQIKDGGVTDFMRKLGTGYATYFNNKYSRVGHLFQGRFRAVHIENDDQLKNIFVYIHTNPAELVAPRWKEGVVENTEAVVKFLESYKWSSYLDYVGKPNFPSLVDRSFFSDIFGGKEMCKEFVNGWVFVKSSGNMEYLEGLTLD